MSNKKTDVWSYLYLVWKHKKMSKICFKYSIYPIKRDSEKLLIFCHGVNSSLFSLVSIVYDIR